MAFDFYTLVNTLQTMGVYQFLFPFLLALAIFYGTLMFALGEKLKKGPVGLISIILAFFVMLFAASSPEIVPFLAVLTGTTGMVATGILMVVVLLALAGFKMDEVFKGDNAKWVIVLVLIGIGILLFMGAGGSNILPSIFISSEITAGIVVIAIIAIAMWFMTHGEGGKSSAPAGGGKTQ
jgi:hypothetical protein